MKGFPSTSKQLYRYSLRQIRHTERQSCHLLYDSEGTRLLRIHVNSQHIRTRVKQRLSAGPKVYGKVRKKKAVEIPNLLI